MSVRPFVNYEKHGQYGAIPPLIASCFSGVSVTG